MRRTLLLLMCLVNAAASVIGLEGKVNKLDSLNQKNPCIAAQYCAYDTLTFNFLTKISMIGFRSQMLEIEGRTLFQGDEPIDFFLYFPPCSKFYPVITMDLTRYSFEVCGEFVYREETTTKEGLKGNKIVIPYGDRKKVALYILPKLMRIKNMGDLEKIEKEHPEVFGSGNNFFFDGKFNAGKITVYDSDPSRLILKMTSSQLAMLKDINFYYERTGDELNLASFSSGMPPFYSVNAKVRIEDTKYQ
jgi:hypothetical protein